MNSCMSIPFQPHPWLRNRHVMTLFPRFYPRRGLLAGIPSEERLFNVAAGSFIKGLCHWQPVRSQTLTVVLVHGLEGCHDSQYMQGTAAKAFRAGFNVIRLNQRNCGDTEHLTPTLYNSALSGDIQAVLTELASKDGLPELWAVGWSMGGNLVLKMAGEVGDSLPALRGVVGVCPVIDPEVCVQALERPANRLYEHHFVVRLKARIARKAALFPDRYSTVPLRRIHRLRELDHVYTAPDAGFQNAEEYYDGAGARHVVSRIRVPALIITAQDDPFVPYPIFSTAAIRDNPQIRVWAPMHGGHCAFFQRPRPEEDMYWAESRIVEAMTQPHRSSNSPRSSENRRVDLEGGAEKQLESARRLDQNGRTDQTPAK